MAKTTQILGDSVERVALDLAGNIAYQEHSETGPQKRDYWITLYFQCLLAVRGKPPEDILPK